MRIQAVTGMPFSLESRHSVGGGSINQAYCIKGNGQQQYFVKLHQANQVWMFEAEALGLQDLAAAGCIRVPAVVCWGVADSRSYLVLEWMDLGRGNISNWLELGRQLAQLHRTPSSQGFGWHQDNTIGSTLQVNPWTQNWAEFFTQHRIGYQLQLLQRKGIQFAASERLLVAIAALLNHNLSPALVHGDLWSGNVGFSAAGEPVIFDPAPYWGDREVDLAMTELFGGFPNGFYEGYQQVLPLAVGYEQRKRVYNLYHILNHLNLFGGAYRAQAEQIMAQIMG